MHFIFLLWGNLNYFNSLNIQTNFRIIGIFGSASRRRGLIIAFMLMGLHSILIFAPGIIIASSFDIHFYNV